jgi:hypothetical protein
MFVRMRVLVRVGLKLHSIMFVVVRVIVHVDSAVGVDVLMLVRVTVLVGIDVMRGLGGFTGKIGLAIDQHIDFGGCDSAAIDS